MTYAISSAEPTELFAYNVKGRALDATLVVHSGVLRATLQFFEITCREPAFRLQASHTADWMANHAHDGERVDDRVGQVGAGFLMADTAIGLAHAAAWAVGHIIDARNWVADRVDDIVDAAVAIQEKVESALAEAAKRIVEIGKLLLVHLPGIIIGAVIVVTFPKVIWLATSLLAYTYVRSLALVLLVPPQKIDNIDIRGYASPVNGSGPMCGLPTTAAELFKRIEDVPEDKPIQIINLGNNQYMILIKGTKGWYGHSNIWPTNVYSGLGYDSVYSERVKTIIEQSIPQGPPPPTLHFAGHSQGGHVAQLVANEYAATGLYTVGSMFSFGAYFAASPHPNIKNAQAFLFVNDPLNVIDNQYDQAVGRETILFDGTQLNPIDAHGDYENSQTLKNIKITYDESVDTSPEVHNYTAPDEPPVVDAISDAVVWAGDNVQTTTETIDDLSSEIANSVSEDYNYISNQIVTDGQQFGNALQDFGDMVTSTVDDLGVL